MPKGTRSLWADSRERDQMDGASRDAYGMVGSTSTPIKAGLGEASEEKGASPDKLLPRKHPRNTNLGSGDTNR